jgi:hypothetical protein
MRMLFRTCCEIKGTNLTPSYSMPHAHARAHAAAQHAPAFVVAWRARVIPQGHAGSVSLYSKDKPRARMCP